METSLIGGRWSARSGIEELMEDLGHALAEGAGKIHMLGGGNPAIIPEVAACWREQMAGLLADPARFDRMMSVYDPPKGNVRFCEALAQYLQHSFGWEIGPENIVVTSGGQTAFFYLFNLLAGEYPDGHRKHILLPLMPEYIGYANQGLTAGMFRGLPPNIEITGPHQFKYRIDFDRLDPDEIAKNCAAVCVSRPTNPSGNVLTDDEMARLDKICQTANVPLIVDNAYGAPFPGILFTHASHDWNENRIMVFSLSKLGLPGTRTAVVVAKPPIIKAIAAMSAVSGLANGTIGQAMVTPLLENGKLDDLVQNSIQPFYQKKSELAQAWVREFFPDTLDYFVHESQGAMFLWIWFRGLPVPVRELYLRLKARGVLIVPGDYFGFGCPEVMDHVGQCIRLNFAMEESSVREGIRIIGEEAAKLHA